MTDPKFNAKDLRDERLPIVSDCRLRYRMSFAKIAKEVEKRCGQIVNPSTIKRDWDYLVKQWRSEAAANTKDACDEELMACDVMIAELTRLYEQSKLPKKTKNAKVNSTLVPLNGRGNPIVGRDESGKLSPEPFAKPVATGSESASKTEERIGDVRILAELRKWHERRDRLLGLNKVQVDITSGGQKFTGFSSVLPVIPNIEEIVQKIDAARMEREEE
jgi:hypothetical protein